MKYAILLLVFLFFVVFVHAEPCHYELVYDLNGDCRGDIADLALLAQIWMIDCEIDPVLPECFPLDLDGDGFDVIADCNDNDATIYPGAPEICDGLDNDCDTVIDEECGVCGNGVIEAGEVCDDGNWQNGDGCDDDVANGGLCVVTACGNGVLTSVTGEECDDGNLTNGDGCSSNCIIEGECGNGVIEAGEVCDDGNWQNGDGCSSMCEIEPGWTCFGEPSICFP